MSSPRCSSCDHRNPACARYCSACGAALALRFEAVFEPERRPWFRRPLVPKDECSPPAGEATVVWRGLEFDAGPSLSRALGMTPRYSIMPVSAEMVRHREHGLEAGPRRKQPSSTAPWPSLDSERTGHPQPIGRPARGPEALRQATRFRASVSAFLLVVVAISAYFVYRPPTYITPTYITQSAGTSLAGADAPSQAVPGDVPSPSGTAKIGVAADATGSINLGAGSVSAGQLTVETPAETERRGHAGRARERTAKSELEKNRPITKNAAAATSKAAQAPRNMTMPITRQLPVMKVCSEAVAALGLCSMNTTAVSE